MNDFYKEQYAERTLKKPNKNISFESLTAAFYLMTAKTKEEFCHYYSLAMHDNNGASVWYWVEKLKPIKKRCE